MKKSIVMTLLSLFVCISSAFAMEAGDLVGKWETAKKNAVFVNLDLKADGTGHFVNYAGKASGGKWTLDGNYLKFEAGGEKSGGIASMEGKVLKVQWVADYTRVK